MRREVLIVMKQALNSVHVLKSCQLLNYPYSVRYFFCNFKGIVARDEYFFEGL
jgi:hypothetical protein